MHRVVDEENDLHQSKEKLTLLHAVEVIELSNELSGKLCTTPKVVDTQQAVENLRIIIANNLTMIFL